jgi:hypothetical protein
MSWERRLREMVLAGGALAATACADNAMNNGVNFCCNANADPCCRYLNCGGPMTTECSQEIACQESGAWDPISKRCSLSQDAGQSDAVSDAAPSDAGADGDAPD